MKDYNKVESCLKSFLKNNKRLSYSMADKNRKRTRKNISNAKRSR